MHTPTPEEQTEVQKAMEGYTLSVKDPAGKPIALLAKARDSFILRNFAGACLKLAAATTEPKTLLTLWTAFRRNSLHRAATGEPEEELFVGLGAEQD